MSSVSAGIGIAAGAGAAQLGIGYGLGVIAWVPSSQDPSQKVWFTSLAWVAWLAASSTVLGALGAERLSSRILDEDDFSRAGQLVLRLLMALASAIGAAITVPLVAVPARFAQQADNALPQYTAGAYAIAGIVVGLVVAVGALHARSIAANVLATGGWLWTLATIATIEGVRTEAGLGTAQLGTWQFKNPTWLRGLVSVPDALLMIGSSIVVAALAALVAVRNGDNRVGIGVSGAAGPVLVSAAYFMSVPGLNSKAQQLSAYVTAPYSVVAGLMASSLVAAIAVGRARASARASEREQVEENLHDEWRKALEEAEKEPSPFDKDTKKTTRSRSTRAKRTKDIEDDGYAPSRAYVSDTATATKSSAESTTRSSRRKEPVNPMWADSARKDAISAAKDAGESDDKQRRGLFRGRRAKQD